MYLTALPQAGYQLSRLKNERLTNVKLLSVANSGYRQLPLGRSGVTSISGGFQNTTPSQEEGNASAFQNKIHQSGYSRYIIVTCVFPQ